MEIENFYFEVSAKLDCCGHLCPVPILMTEDKMAELKKDEVVEVAFTDAGAKADLDAWCRATGNSLLGFKNEKTKSFAYIRKSGL